MEEKYKIANLTEGCLENSETLGSMLTGIQYQGKDIITLKFIKDGKGLSFNVIQCLYLSSTLCVNDKVEKIIFSKVIGARGYFLCQKFNVSKENFFNFKIESGNKLCEGIAAFIHVSEILWEYDFSTDRNWNKDIYSVE